jgi:hypothetical protein
MNKKIIQTILVLAIMFSPILINSLHAQPGFSDDVDDVPLDGGLSLLIAAGAGYGARRLKKKQPNQ